MKKFIILIAIVCFSQHLIKAAFQPQEQTSYSSIEAFKNTTITFELIPTYNHTRDNDISVGNKLRIHQPNIPSIKRNAGFKRKKQR